MVDITLEETGSKGRVKVRYVGQVLLASARDPEHEAARALLARGITGKCRTLDHLTGAHRMTLDIERAAKYSITEDDFNGLKRRKWRPFDPAKVGRA